MKLNCQKAKELIPRYIDGELDQEASGHIKEHLSSCPLCSLQFQDEKKVDSLIRQHVSKDEAPFELREAVISRLEEPSGGGWIPGFFLFKNIPSAVFAGALVLIVSFGIFSKSNTPFPLFSESVSRHMEFMKGGLPIEISSSDVKEVTQWLQGKLDFAIQIPDISSDAVKLVGARICHIKDKKVAYLVFDKQGENISVFLMDTHGVNIPRSKKMDKGEKVFYVQNHKGYQSILCVEGASPGMGCVFVSDMSEEELMNLIAA